MKKNLTVLMTLLLVIAVVVPAFALDFKYGGQFRARWISNDHMDGTSEVGTNDNQNFFDQRLRLYFTFIASENLRVVTKFEIGDSIWGRTNATGGLVANGRFGAGGNVGADAVNVETKNAYVDFNIPMTPVTGLVGIQGINLLNSWIIDDDFSAAVFKANLDPVKVHVGYVAGQNDDVTKWQDRVDSWFLSADYKSGPLSGSLIGYFQFGHNTSVSADPAVMVTPFWKEVPFGNGNLAGSPLLTQWDLLAGTIKNNDLFDLGFNLEYKQPSYSAYVTFVKNLGSVDVEGVSTAGNPVSKSIDYDGLMVDAGFNYFCGPFTANLGGFYTSGDKPNDDRALNRFVYPMSTSKYFSEIVGGGILDNVTTIAHTNAAGAKDFQWEGYQFPTNVWTVTLGGSYQVLEKTKLSMSYWYFGTSEDVVSKVYANGDLGYANDIGHELDFYLSQGIVDGLTLDIVGAYLIAGDAFSAADHKENVYEFGARLQWNF